MASLRARLYVVIAAGAAAACTSRYVDTYQPNTDMVDAGFVRAAGEPVVERASDDISRDVRAKYEVGMGVVGQSAFVGLGESESGAVDQARQVGAAVVLLDISYKGVQPGIGPIYTLLPATETEARLPTADEFAWFSYYDLPASAPFQEHRKVYTRTLGVYAQRALYFEPLDRTGAGVLFGDQTNVAAVRKESPAAQADIRAGDVLVSVGGSRVADQSAARAALGAAKGKSVEIALSRDGAQMMKKMTVPEGTW